MSDDYNTKVCSVNGEEQIALAMPLSVFEHLNLKLGDTLVWNVVKGKGTSKKVILEVHPQEK